MYVFIWWTWRLTPGLCTHEVSALPLSYIPHHLFYFGHYVRGSSWWPSCLSLQSAGIIGASCLSVFSRFCEAFPLSSQPFSGLGELYPGYFVLTGCLMWQLTGCNCLGFITFPSLIWDPINLAAALDTVLGEHLWGNRPISVVFHCRISGLEWVSVLAHFSGILKLWLLFC